MHFFYLVTALFVLSQSAIFIRFAQAHAAAIGFWRLIIALPILAIMLVLKKRTRDVFLLSRKDYIRIFLCGFFLFLHFYTWFLSVQKTSVANSMILFASNPLFTALGAWFFFEEKIHLRHFLSLFLCLCGIYFLVKQSLVLDVKNLEGDILALLCGVLFSAYVLVGKKIRSTVHNLPFSFLTYLSCCFCFFLLMLYLKLPFFQYNAKTWAAFSALAFGSTLLGHSLFTHCLQFFNVNLMSVSTLAEPIATMISASYFFGEAITPNAVLGFIFISAGILVLYSVYIRALFRVGPK